MWSGWWWKLPLLVAVLWLVWPREGVAGFPTCGAAASRELVRRAIEDADDRAQVHRRLLALDEVREVSFDAARQDRMCAGVAVLNAGERRIVWRLYRRGDGILVNVTGF